ncbi:MAG: PhoH family protein [Bacteroidales bacterium]|nr:PhoH family protein [Bacteroidales bacterium]
MSAKKNFVIDTNVILHDFRCLENFQENDVYLPIIVLEELDKFKKGSEQINYSAREFIRLLDDLSDNDLFEKGASLGPGKGKLFIIAGDQYSERIAASFPERTPDHRILSCTLHLSEKNKKAKTILVTKDVNLRMKARSLGIAAEDYISDKIVNVDIFRDNQNEYDDIDPELIDKIYASKEGIDISELSFGDKIEPNECFLLKSFRNSVPVRYSPFTGKVKAVEKVSCFGIIPRNVEQSFAFELLTDPDVKLVGISGKAGTGKTLLALAAALKQRFLYKQILLARPIVSLSNKEIGFLPGDEKQKISPYMQPLFDNLTVIKNNLMPGAAEAKEIESMQNDGRLVIEALAFIRGRSLSDTFFIVDEAQNLTPLEIKTIITRAGDGTKIIFTGDIYQIDSPYLDAQSNGLAYMIDKMQGQELFGHVNLLKGERSQLSELASNLL